jgi:SNF2 family DNA or RNA helicase
MYIHKRKKAVVMKLRHPSRVTSVIPTARMVNDNVVALPHRPDETRVLRNLGFTLPDPMPIHYVYPLANGRFNPFEVQQDTANFLSMQRRAFCLNDMGTGKTNAALWAYDYLRSVKQAKRLLVVCPLSTMERTWADAIFMTFPHLDAAVLYGSRERRLKLLKQEADIYIINIDGIAIIAKELAKRPDIDIVVVDELAMARNAQTDRWKILNEICNRQSPRRVWGMTGSPTPNSPTDAWAQCRLITPDNPDVPRYFGRFKDSVMRQLTPFKWIARSTANDTIFQCMQPAIRYALDDCVDLPEQVVLTREVALTPEQDKAYKDMMTRLATEASGGQILAVNEAVKANKLIQIACGVAYGTNGENIIIPSKPRIDAVKELIEESEGKVIVFVPLTGALESIAVEVAKMFKDEHNVADMVADKLEGGLGLNSMVRVVHGGTSKAQRDTTFKDFQQQDEPRVLIANAQTMSHGLTLTAATTIVWYAPVHSNEIYQQACARVRRPGQTKKTRIVHIAGTPVERMIYKRLAAKESMQGVLLDMVKGNNGNETS